MKLRHIFTAVIIAVCLFCFAACKTEKDLTAPVPVLDGNVVSWEEVDGAEKYVVTVNGLQSETEQTTYTLEVTEPGVYDIYVSAVKGEEKKTSEMLTYTVTAQLSAPEITISGNVVSWNAVENAKNYSVFINGSLKTTTDKTRYTVTEEEAGEYVITVKADANGVYTQSGVSNSVTYTVEDANVNIVRLGAPEITLTKRTLTWDAVENATAYKIYVNGAEYASVNGLSYTVTMRSAGSYEIAVTAVNPSSDYVESDKSNAVELAIAPLDLTKPVVPYIVANGATADYSETQGKLVEAGLWNDSGLDDDFLTRAWRLIPAGEYYKIKLSNGAYLTSARGASYAWYEADCGADGQLWEIRQTDGGYHILNKAVGEYLFCSDNSSGLHFYHDVNLDVQKWNMFNVEVEFGEDMTVLEAPEVSIDGNVVTWEEVDGVTGYKVYVNGEYVLTVEETEYTIQADEEKLYTVTVRASGEGVLDSVFSNEVSYMHSDLQLTEPIFATYTANNGTVYAAAYDGEGFVTMINADEITDFSAYMWYLEENGGYYRIKFANGYYLTRVSNGDNGPEGRLLPATDGDNQLWKLVADGFNKYKLQNKEHANSYGDGYYYGEWYNVFKFADACFGWDFVNKDIAFGGVTQLEAPQASIDGNVVTWEEVEGADCYDVYVDGEFAETVTETTYTVLGTEQKLYTVRVKAKGENVLDSFLSNAVSYMHSTLDLAKPLFVTHSFGGNTYAAVANDEGFVVAVNVDEITDRTAYMWYAEAEGEYFKIKFANGYYLTRVSNGDTGPEAMLAPANGADSQLWKFVADGFNKYKLQNKSHIAQWGDGFYYGETNGIFKFASACLGWDFENDEIAFGQIKKLSAPVISLDGDTASWTAVGNAEGYEIYVNGEKVATVTDTTYTLTESGDVLRIKAVAEGFEPSYLSNSVTYTNLFANPVVAYYTCDGDAKNKVLKILEDGTLNYDVVYTEINDYTEYLWTMEKVRYNGETYYMIKLYDGRYLSQHDSEGNASKVSAEIKNDQDTRQLWILVPDGDSGTCYKLQSLYMNSYGGGNLGEWWGYPQFEGGRPGWEFFNP